MNETVSYNVTPEMKKQAVSAYFWKHIIGHRGWLTLAFAILGLTFHYPSFSKTENVVGTVLLSLAAFSAFSFIKAYYLLTRYSKDANKLYESTKTSITLTDDKLITARDQSRDAVNWCHITKAIDTKGLLLLFSNTLVVAKLHKHYFSPTQLDFIYKKISLTPKNADRHQTKIAAPEKQVYSSVQQDKNTPPPLPVASNKDVKQAGFWRRFLAFFIDHFIVSTFVFLLIILLALALPQHFVVTAPFGLFTTETVIETEKTQQKNSDDSTTAIETRLVEVSCLGKWNYLYTEELTHNAGSTVTTRQLIDPVTRETKTMTSSNDIITLAMLI